eukprot:3255302-Pyramimonas_sp.AAC.1
MPQDRPLSGLDPARESIANMKNVWASNFESHGLKYRGPNFVSSVDVPRCLGRSIYPRRRRDGERREGSRRSSSISGGETASFPLQGVDVPGTLSL